MKSQIGRQRKSTRWRGQRPVSGAKFKALPFRFESKAGLPDKRILTAECFAGSPARVTRIVKQEGAQALEVGVCLLDPWRMAAALENRQLRPVIRHQA